MNSIQILTLFFTGLLIFWGVVFFLTLLGMPLVWAFLLVYVAGVFLMAGMQRRARDCAEMQRSDVPNAGRTVVTRIYTPAQLFKAQ